MPLAVVGSNVVVEVNGKKVRGRQYPWGVAEGTSVEEVLHRREAATLLSFAAAQESDSSSSSSSL